MLRIKKFYTKLLLAIGGIATTFGLVNCNGGFEVADTCFNDGGDPFFSYAWHLANCGQSVFSKSGGVAGIDMNLRATWSSGLSGDGIKVRVSDDGLENTHEDLTGNFQTAVARSRNYITGSPGSDYKTTTAIPRDGVFGGENFYDDHGTSVAGIIAAVAGNGKGARGVAPKAALSAANILTGGLSQTTNFLINQADGDDFDISNMSWGSVQYDLTPVNTSYEAQLKAGVTTLRSGKGVIYVKAAGNSFTSYCHGNATPSSNLRCIANSNFDGDNTNPYQIIVGALNAKGTSSSYSSPGSNIWISGFGGEYGYAAPAMLTTDRMGCVNGWANYNAGADIAFDNGGSPNSSCNYTATFNGTSSAAPTISGAAALMLEANPNLTWRDVKYILAKTAVPVDYVTTGSIANPRYSSPTGYSWEIPWRTNGAGYKFHNWYGFGKVDVDAAVAMAKSYTSSLGTYTETSWATTGVISVPVADNSLAGAALSSIAITSGSASDVKIEAVRISVNITHDDISQLAIELTSPSGMKSILVNMNNSLLNVQNYSSTILLSNAFYGERSSVPTASSNLWTLKVIDGKLDAKAGTLTGWSIQFVGAP